MLTKVDPITFEIIRHKLWQITDEMGLTLKRVSGSPTTTEAHDFMVGLYRANGDILVAGAGATWHIVCASAACKSILNRFGVEGVGEDDIFLLNDPYIAAYHQSDVYIITPIHFKGQLAGWSANFTHVTDIGGIDPGGMCPRATEVFHEGLRIPGVKIAERGRFRWDVMEALLNMTRDPGMTSLDLRSEIAANNVAKTRLRELVDKYGMETVDAVAAGMIEHSESLLRRRLMKLPDGAWHALSYIDTDLPDLFYRMQLCLTKKGDQLVFDFAGSSPQAAKGINCTYLGTLGSVYAAVATQLAYDTAWNEGLLKPIVVKTPEGSVVSSKYPAPVSMATITAGHLSLLLAGEVLSKMLCSSDLSRDEGMATWVGGIQSVRPSGLGREGRPYMVAILHIMAGSGGARSFSDGVDTGGMFAYPISSGPNVESYELNYPILHLFRRQTPDSGGPGKYRGGMSGEYCFRVHDAPERATRITVSGMGINAIQAHGLHGGYPGASGQVIIYQDGHIDNIRFDNGTLTAPQPAHSVIPCLASFEIKESDIVFVRWAGSGGYGDPLDRGPSSVTGDLALGAISPWAARNIYGVELDAAGNLDAEKTLMLRQAIKKGRLQNGRMP
ncbi:MAG: hydantoinase B/oxoprolinase family protein [Chloroflexi bacterium]|nr:hydantoinase B/oxoprolinase family protein [Chloroflexota bacterium]